MSKLSDEKFNEESGLRNAYKDSSKEQPSEQLDRNILQLAAKDVHSERLSKGNADKSRPPNYRNWWMRLIAAPLFQSAAAIALVAIILIPLMPYQTFAPSKVQTDGDRTKDTSHNIEAEKQKAAKSAAKSRENRRKTQESGSSSVSAIELAQAPPAPPVAPESRAKGEESEKNEGGASDAVKSARLAEENIAAETFQAPVEPKQRSEIESRDVVGPLKSDLLKLEPREWEKRLSKLLKEKQMERLKLEIEWFVKAYPKYPIKPELTEPLRQR